MPWSFGKQIPSHSQNTKCFFFFQKYNVNYMLIVTRCCTGCQGSCQSPAHKQWDGGLERRVMWILSKKDNLCRGELQHAHLEEVLWIQKEGRFVGSISDSGNDWDRELSLVRKLQTRNPKVWGLLLGPLAVGSSVPNWISGCHATPLCIWDGKLHSSIPRVYTMLHIRRHTIQFIE